MRKLIYLRHIAFVVAWLFVLLIGGVTEFHRNWAYLASTLLALVLFVDLARARRK